MPNDESLNGYEQEVCGVCGKPTLWGATRRCYNCWEVERRVEEYAKSRKGLDLLGRYALTPPLPPPSFTPSSNLVYVVHSGPDAIQVFQIKSDAEACAKSSKDRSVKEIDLRFLDDWPHPDDWDYEAILKEYEVKVIWSDTLIDGEGRTFPDQNPGWALAWERGTIWIGKAKEEHARKAAAMFVSLWQRGVSASLANTLMDGYITNLELQEGPSIGRRAYKILKTLNETMPLGDFVYDVREHEGKGWEGPKVVTWGDACEDMWKLFRETE